MRRDNHKKFIFWLIGFGCGIILSGIVMIGVTFNTAEYQEQLANKFSISEKDKSSPPGAKAVTDNTEASQVTNNKANIQISGEEFEEENIEEEQIAVSPDSTLAEVKQEEKQKTVTVYIPSNTNATKICELLEKEGVIQDSEDFLKFIVKNKKTKRLRGNVEKTFPLDGDYDVILNLLVNR